MKTRRVLLALGLAGAVAVPHQAATTGLTLAVPGRSNAHVSLAAEGAFLVAVWAAALPGGSTDIYSAVSRDGGATFQRPVRVNGTPGDARVNGEQPPRVTIVWRQGTEPLLTVVWTAKRQNGTLILDARSEDGGRTFGRTAPIPGGEAAGNRGWQGVAADAAGRTRVVWLDHREMANHDAASATAGHHHEGHDPAPAAKSDGVATAQRSKLFISTIGDASSAKALTAGVCYCCKTAVVAGPADTLHLAWRHVYPGNLRDIAFSTSHDGGRTFTAPARVSDDRWQLDGCPDDGPAMTRTADGRLHIVWPTLVVGAGAGAQPTIGLFHASSKDGASFSARVRVPTEGLPHHPQIASTPSRGFALVWDELERGRRRAVLAWGTVGAGGAVTFTREVLGAGEAAAYPTVAATADGVVTAWTSGGAGVTVVHVERRGVPRS